LTAVPLPEVFVPAEPKEIQGMYVHPEQPEPIVLHEPIVRKELIEAHGLIPVEAHGYEPAEAVAMKIQEELPVALVTHGVEVTMAEVLRAYKEATAPNKDILIAM